MRHFGLFGLIVLLGVALAGCGGDQQLNPNDVEQTYGAVTTTDEPPQFAEPAVFGAQGMAEADPVQSDPLAGQPVVQQAEQTAKRIHFLVLVWGDVRAASTETPAATPGPRDFSGSLTLSEGAALVTRKLRMEPRQGDGVLPRSDAKVVQWKSTIYEGVDGLLVRLAAPETATVTVTLAGLTLKKTMEELDLAQGLLEVPGSDDGLVWAAAAQTTGAGCEHGYLAGRWHRLRAIGGVFRGKWVSSDGALRGHLRGIFGQRKGGDKVFFGKWIAAGGEFQGLLAGHFGDGAFQGHYLDGALALRGRISGVYLEPRLLDARKMGVLLGTWHKACEAEPLAAGETEVH